jgi:Flp pilus assembly protein TadD
VSMGTRWLAVTVMVLLARGGAAQDADLDALLSRAVVLHQSGDLEGAAALYVQVLRVVPGASRIRSNLGAAYAGLGRYDDAIVEYRRALEGEDDPSIRQNLALSLQKAGHLDEAAEEATRVLGAEPGNHAVLLLLADTELRRGRNEHVVQLLGPALEARPEDKSAAYLLGSALLELDRTAEAQTVLDRLFRDDSAEGHVLLGTLLAKRRDWPAALAEYEKARSANPKLPLVNYLVGEALMRGREDWAGAAAALRAELSTNPYHFESNLLLGTLLLEGGSLQEALGHLERAAQLRPGDLSVKYPLGTAYLNAGRLEEARALLEAVAAAAPGHLQTQMKLAALYTKLGLTEDAARARANAAKLLKEADAQAFQGGKQIIEKALGSDPAPQVPPKPR